MILSAAICYKFEDAKKYCSVYLYFFYKINPCFLVYEITTFVVLYAVYSAQIFGSIFQKRQWAQFIVTGLDMTIQIVAVKAVSL